MFIDESEWFTHYIACLFIAVPHNGKYYSEWGMLGLWVSCFVIPLTATHTLCSQAQCHPCSCLFPLVVLIFLSHYFPLFSFCFAYVSPSHPSLMSSLPFSLPPSLLPSLPSLPPSLPPSLSFSLPFTLHQTPAGCIRGIERTRVQSREWP